MIVRLPHRAVRRSAAAAVLVALAVAVGLSRVPGSQAAARVAFRPVDLNAAGPDELALLPGVGPSLARAIVDDRRERGPFRDLGDLDRVRGVGPGILARVRPHVSFGGASVAPSA